MSSVKNILKAVYVSFMRVVTLLQFRLHGVSCGKRIRVVGGLVYIKARRNSIVIGNNVNINSSAKSDPIGMGSKTMLVVKPGGAIRIADGVGMSNCTIVSQSSVDIGKRVVIGGGTCIYDTDFHSVYAEARLNRNTDIVTKPVMIGDEAFVGGGVTILKGVHIGERAVIGAGSVVSKDVPAGEVWAGNPAKYIRTIYEKDPKSKSSFEKSNA